MMWHMFIVQKMSAAAYLIEKVVIDVYIYHIYMCMNQHLSSAGVSVNSHYLYIE